MASLLGKYQLLASLGHGGMADVFLAVARGPAGFSKLQVIKKLRPNLADEPEFLKMFLDEARLAARLNHPNVVQTNEVGEANGRYYIAMEYLDGQPLNRLLQAASAKKTVPLEICLTILSQALSGLHHAHELTDFDGKPLTVVHRDVSPHNIFVLHDGFTKLVDFGIAKAATRSAETRAGTVKGKVAYMCPEQARSGPLDRRADVFSMGAILWQVIAGQRLWKGLGEGEILDQLLSGNIPSVRSVRPDAPVELEAICAKALAFDRQDRYQTAAQLREAIDAYLDEHLQRATETDIARMMTDLFGEERAELKALIERRLSGLGTDGDVEPTSADSAQDEVTASIPRLVTSGGTTGPTPSGQLQTGDPMTRSATGSTGERAPSRAGARTVLAVALAGLAAGALWLGLRATNDAGTAAPTQATVPSAATPSTPEPPQADSRLCEVTIAAEPADARLYLDDTPLPSNPFAGKFPADGASHRIRAEAAGFTPQSSIAVFGAQPVQLTLALVREQPPAPAATSAALPPRRPRPAAKPGATGKPGASSSKGGAQLDKDPWAN